MRTARLLSFLLLAAPVAHAAKPAPQQPAQPNQPQAKDADHDYTRLKFDAQGNPLPVSTAASESARNDLQNAKAALTKAIGGMPGKETYQVDNALLKNDDYRTALLNLRRAQADYDTARQPIFDALRADAEYKELLKREEENQQAIQALIIMGRGNFDWLFPTALASLEIRKSMTRDQIIALAQAPEVEDARQRMLIAAAKLRQLRGAYVNENTNGAAAQAAKSDLDDARAKVSEAQTAYSKALAEEAQYERIRTNYDVETRLTGKPPVVATK